MYLLRVLSNIFGKQVTGIVVKSHGNKTSYTTPFVTRYDGTVSRYTCLITGLDDQFGV